MTDFHIFVSFCAGGCGDGGGDCGGCGDTTYSGDLGASTVGGVIAYRLAPQLVQNFAPSSILFPQLAQNMFLPPKLSVK
jgi:hypothetical protein